MIRSATALAGILTLLATTAHAQAPSATPARAEVIHWWTSAGESASLKVFADAFTKAGGTWVDNAIAGGANARAAAINRTVGGDPPTAMQFNTGKQFDDLVENNLLANVDALAKAENWAAVMPPPILAAVTRDGHQYAVPVNIHGQNWFFFSNPALARAGATSPQNWTDLFTVLDKLKAAGITPLAFSGQKTWERGLFNTTLVGVGGADMFARFWGKRDVAMLKTAEFRKVIDTYRKLHAYVDAGSPGRNWNDATTLVIQGKAGMQVMGDWAKGEFTAAGQIAGKDYGCTVLSDSGTSYLMGGDVFAFPKPKNAEVARAQSIMEKAMTDPATQAAFSAKKGSIPARQDADVSGLDECARKAHGWLQDVKAQVPANELLSPPAVTGAIEDLVSQFWNDPSMTPEVLTAKIGAVFSQSF